MTYAERLEAELRDADPLPDAYVSADTPQFERIALAEARYNRALLYPSFLLHSGAISMRGPISASPRTGRLTVTGFLSVGQAAMPDR